MSDAFDVIGGIADLFWMSSQSSKICDLNREVERLKQSARSTAKKDPIQAQIEELKAANGELRLYVSTLLRVLQDKGVIARDDLLKLVEQIDAEDGRRDQSFHGDLLP